MTPSPHEPSLLSRVVRAAVAVLLLLAVSGRAAFLLLPVNSDTAIFVYAGKLVAEGGRPGVDLLDNKLPTVGWLMSVPWRLFGATWPAYAAAGLLLSLTASVVLWRATRDLWGRPAAAAVAVASAVWLNAFPAAYGALQLEVVQACLASIAAATTLRLLRRDDWRDAVLIGLCGGVAAWAKPTGLAVVAAAGLAVLTNDAFPVARRLRAGAWLAFGGVLPVAVAAWLVVGTGTGDGFAQSVRQLRDYAAGSSLDAVDWMKPVLVLGLLALPVLVLGVVCRRDPRASRATRPDTAFVVLWLAAELVGVVLQRRMYVYHFLTLGPPAALAVGLVARRPRAVPMVMAFGPFAAASAAWALAAVLGRPVASRDDRVIAFVERHTVDADAVWADDYARLLVETGRRAGSAVPLLFLMANGDDAPAFFGARLLADFERRRPACVVFAADPARLTRLYRHHMADVAASPTRADGIARQIDAIAAYLVTHYDAGPDIDGLRVWRRKADADTALVRGDDAR